MPRQVRIQCPGAMYHVMSRGNRRQEIYFDDVDRQDFLKTLAEACQKTAWQLHAYPWSSFGYYLAAPEHRPQWLRVDRLLGEHGLQQDSAAARREFERRTEALRLAAGQEESLKALRRGWCLGSEEFKQQKLEQIDGQVGQHHFGRMRLELAHAKAERIIGEELRRLGWPEAQLALRRKRDPSKLEIAARLRRETTLSVKEIAARLHLGTPASASLCLLATLRKTTAGTPTQCRLAI